MRPSSECNSSSSLSSTQSQSHTLSSTGRLADDSSQTPKMNTVQEIPKEHKVWDASSESLGGEEEAEFADDSALTSPPQQACEGTPASAEMHVLPSIGSASHEAGTCKPCSFANTKGGCRWAENCDFCHYMHKRQKLSKKRRAHCQRFIEQQEIQIAADPEAVSQIAETMPPVVQSRPALKGKIMTRLNVYAEALRKQHEEPEFQTAPSPDRSHIVAL